MRIERVQEFLDEMADQMGLSTRYLVHGHSRGRAWNVTAQEDSRQLQMGFAELDGRPVLCSVIARNHSDPRRLEPDS